MYATVIFKLSFAGSSVIRLSLFLCLSLSHRLLSLGYCLLVVELFAHPVVEHSNEIPSQPSVCRLNRGAGTHSLYHYNPPEAHLFNQSQVIEYRIHDISR